MPTCKHQIGNTICAKNISCNGCKVPCAHYEPFKTWFFNSVNVKDTLATVSPDGYLQSTCHHEINKHFAKILEDNANGN